jgi:lipopolysaccharide export system permease protein
MAKIKDYLSVNFGRTFFMIFLPFFAIISLVYFIRISMLTNQIQLDFIDVLKLYGYFLPSIIFYTLPVSFVATISLTLVRLSNDNELGALYSFGVSSSSIVKKYFTLSILFSMLLFAISFFAMPVSKQLYNSFKITKLSEAKLNVDPNSLGQKFDDYYLFINSQDATQYHDIVIYNPNAKKGEQIFLAKNGKIVNNPQSQGYFMLEDGFAYTYDKEKLRQAKFKQLIAYDTSNKGEISFQTISEYWSDTLKDKKEKNRIFFFIFISLMPIITLYTIASFSMIHSRYQSNNSYAVIFAVSLASYIYASFLERYGNIFWLIFGILAVVIFGKITFKNRVEKVF